MSATKASILALANMLCYNLGNTVQMDRFYYEVELELAQDPRLFQHTRFSAPPPAFNLTEAVLPDCLTFSAIFYQGRQLVAAAQDELDATNPKWRDEEGVPIAYTRDYISNEKVRLFPKRLDNNDDRLTLDYFITQTTDVNIPAVLELPFALFILAREFMRESPHRDLVFAQMCNKLGNDLVALLA